MALNSATKVVSIYLAIRWQSAFLLFIFLYVEGILCFGRAESVYCPSYGMSLVVDSQHRLLRPGLFLNLKIPWFLGLFLSIQMTEIIQVKVFCGVLKWYLTVLLDAKRWRLSCTGTMRSLALWTSSVMEMTLRWPEKREWWAQLDKSLCGEPKPWWEAYPSWSYKS